MKDVLLTVSGNIDPALEENIRAGKRPRADYLEMARAFNADVLDYQAARRDAGFFGRIIARFAGINALMAWVCWSKRHQYRAIFTDGEQVGIPLAVLLKYLGRGAQRARHLMIVHTLHVRKKMLLLDGLRLSTHIDRFLVYSSWQKRFIEERWGVPSARVIFTMFMVDDQFFHLSQVSSRAGDSAAPRMICAVGLERRDYPTLIEAVRDLPVQLVIAAASPWSKQTDSSDRTNLPENVTVKRFTQAELRQLYADSAFLVMPLQDVTFQAGITAILEAMSMERAVICSRTPGQTDAIVEGENGTYVAPGDSAALRSAIEQLLNDPDRARQLGQNGRQTVESRAALDVYVEGLRTVVLECVGDARQRTHASR
jgi:glycosyltransferase involved in cell wall biosynthesis